MEREGRQGEEEWIGRGEGQYLGNGRICVQYVSIHVHILPQKSP